MGQKEKHYPLRGRGGGGPEACFQIQNENAIDGKYCYANVQTKHTGSEENADNVPKIPQLYLLNARQYKFVFLPQPAFCILDIRVCPSGHKLTLQKIIIIHKQIP